MILEKFWEKAERDEEKMFKLLMMINTVKPEIFIKALKELIHHYAQTRRSSD